MKKDSRRFHEFQFFAKHLKPHAYRLVFVLLIFLAGGFVVFFNPIITKNIVDKGVNNKDIHFVLAMLAIQLSLFVGNSVIDLIRSFLLVKVNNQFSISILHDFILKLTRLPIHFFDKKMAGDLQQRIYDHYRIQSFLTSSSITFVVAIVSFFAYASTLVYFNWHILVVLLFFSTLEVLWIMHFQKKRKELDYAKFYRMGNNQDNVLEIIVGMQEIKLNNAENKKIQKWYTSQSKLAELNIKAMKVDQSQMTGSNLLDQLANVIISFIAAYGVINNTMSLGMMMSIGVITGQLKGTISQFLYLIRAYQEAAISIERLMEIHEKKNEDEFTHDNPLKPGTTIDNISLNAVSFSYDGNATPVLKNVSVSVDSGKTLAIVGNSGSGKTTLLKLLLKFYAPTTGKIYINGDTDLQNIPSGWWRNKCGTIMQDGYIFSDTIAENIAVNDKEIDAEKLAHAASVANILDFIESLPQKWDTIIGDNGLGLSGGQKQRLLIARSIYKNPAILLFDEATSALDAENEKIIMKNIEQFFYDKTKIIIAHRFSTIKNADHIIVLDKGMIVEQGTHQELIAVGGKYFALLSDQLNLNTADEKVNIAY